MVTLRKTVVSHFNPRSPHGERQQCAGLLQPFFAFQSTLPARGATQQPFMAEIVPLISIHAPRTGSDPLARACAGLVTISIHAPRTGSDSIGQLSTRVNSAISIHAPRTGSDVLLLIANARTGTFQSTLPARGATTSSPASCCRRCHFNPRSPHGERQLPNQAGLAPGKFQSTLPARGATVEASYAAGTFAISIHAPRTGSDWR